MLYVQMGVYSIVEYNQIIQGDSLTVLKTLLDESVNCCVTSPPYWGLRDYGIDPIIWDGVEGCEHKWGVDSKVEYDNNNKIYDNEWVRPSRIEYQKVGDTFKCVVCGKDFHGKIGQKFCSTKCLNTLNNEQRQNSKPNQSFCNNCFAWRGSLGLEPTFELYINHLCDIFDEVKRVLRKDGTCWVNLGDVFASSPAGNKEIKYNGDGVYGRLMNRHTQGGTSEVTYKPKKYSVPTKSLCLIPQRFAIEMVNRGWILRNTIIWHKPNCMPSSASDRFTVDFEYLFFFTKNNKAIFWTNERTGACVDKQPSGTKGIEGIDWEWRKIGENYSNCDTKIDNEIAETLNSPRARKYRDKELKKVSLWTGHDYWFEQQLEPYQPDSLRLTKINKNNPKGMNRQGLDNWLQRLPENRPHGIVRNREYGYQGKYKVMPPIGGIKKAGGNNPTYSGNQPLWGIGRNKRCVWTISTHPFPEAHFAVYPEALIETPIQAGCPKGGIVLDPFMGAGTTAVVAKKQGKRFIGIEIKQEYIDMANKRIKAVRELLF